MPVPAGKAVCLARVTNHAGYVGIEVLICRIFRGQWKEPRKINGANPLSGAPGSVVNKTLPKSTKSGAGGH
jgi:hypothetical protein